VGEEPEEDRNAQPGALDGLSLLQPGHEPFWRHGETHTHTHNCVSPGHSCQGLFEGLEDKKLINFDPFSIINIMHIKYIHEKESGTRT